VINAVPIIVNVPYCPAINESNPVMLFVVGGEDNYVSIVHDLRL
jgi:hypothetical protein